MVFSLYKYTSLFCDRLLDILQFFVIVTRAKNSKCERLFHVHNKQHRLCAFNK